MKLKDGKKIHKYIPHSTYMLQFSCQNQIHIYLFLIYYTDTLFPKKTHIFNLCIKISSCPSVKVSLFLYFFFAVILLILLIIISIPFLIDFSFFFVFSVIMHTIQRIYLLYKISSKTKLHRSKKKKKKKS